MNIDTYNLERLTNSMSTSGDLSTSDVTEMMAKTSSERSFCNILGILTSIRSTSFNRHSLGYNVISYLVKNEMIDEVIPRYTDALIDQSHEEEHNPFVVDCDLFIYI